jgi:hypothetical protein
LKQYRQSLREKVINAYGGKCSCVNCPENNPEFLTIDHVNNDGQNWIKIHGIGISLYLWLIRNNFPRDNFRLMCYNCNCGRAHHGGVCPHEEVG